MGLLAPPKLDVAPKEKEGAEAAGCGAAGGGAEKEEVEPNEKGDLAAPFVDEAEALPSAAKGFAAAGAAGAVDPPARAANGLGAATAPKPDDCRVKLGRQPSR